MGPRKSHRVLGPKFWAASALWNSDAGLARGRGRTHTTPNRAAHRPLEAVGEQPPEDDREGQRGGGAPLRHQDERAVGGERARPQHAVGGERQVDDERLVDDVDGEADVGEEAQRLRAEEGVRRRRWLCCARRVREGDDELVEEDRQERLAEDAAEVAEAGRSEEELLEDAEDDDEEPHEE